MKSTLKALKFNRTKNKREKNVNRQTAISLSSCSLISDKVLEE
jgi:hypothetical protein